MSSEILETIVSKDDQSRLVDQLRQLKESLYAEGKSSSDAIDELFDEKKSLLIRNFFEENKGNEDKEIERLIQTIMELEVVTITVARDMPKKFVSNIHHRLLSMIERPIIVKIVIDQSIIAGAIIEYKGRFYDGSLKDQVAAYIQKLEPKILSSFVTGRLNQKL